MQVQWRIQKGVLRGLQPPLNFQKRAVTSVAVVVDLVVMLTGLLLRMPLKTNTLSAMGEQELAGVTLSTSVHHCEVLQLDASHVACGFLQNNYNMIDLQLYPILFE